MKLLFNVFGSKSASGSVRLFNSCRGWSRIPLYVL